MYYVYSDECQCECVITKKNLQLETGLSEVSSAVLLLELFFTEVISIGVCKFGNERNVTHRP